jgi:hypothetical protein
MNLGELTVTSQVHSFRHSAVEMRAVEGSAETPHVESRRNHHDLPLGPIGC